MIETTTDLLKLFRKDARDTVKPYLWSDDEILTYIDDAHNMFWRLTDGIADASSCATQIPVVTGEPFAPLHPSVLTIRGAKLVSAARPVLRLSYESSGTLKDDYGFHYSSGISDAPGAVRAMVLGMEKDKVRWDAVPAEDDTVQLVIYRLPLEPIAAHDKPFELDHQHRSHLLNWVAHRAYLKQDADAYDKSKSDRAEEKFRAYCAQAQAEQGRARHKPRRVKYGGL